MHQLKLCQTREYHPRDIEHYLHTIQKSKKYHEIIYICKNGKIEINSTENLEKIFPFSKSIKIDTKKNLKKLYLQNNLCNKKSDFFVSQTKGSLMPIKRYSQFEDRINKERIFPANALIHEMQKINASFLKFTFKPVKDRLREKALKKAKKTYFIPDRKFDQWESKKWFSISIRRYIGPIFRELISKMPQTKLQEEKTETTHEREDPKSAILDKLSRPLFEVKIEMSHPLLKFFNGFTIPYLNGFKIKRRPAKNILSAEELATILAPPDLKTCAPFMELESSAYIETPKNCLDISEEDRKRHIYILGKTGMGKSSTILSFLKTDFQKNFSTIVLDPHGDLISDILPLIPKNRQNNLIVLDPSNTEYPVGINPLELLSHENPALKASWNTEIFEVLAKGSWGPRLEYILRNTLLSLSLIPNTTLLDLPRFLTNENFCKEKITQISDPELKRFWTEEFLSQDLKTRQEFIAPILNKVGPLLTSPILRNIFGQPKNEFSFSEAFDQNKIILIRLPKGSIGEDASKMLGMIFISMIQSALLNRTQKMASQRKTITLYIDEFQNFCSKTLLSMLSESRKYGLALTLANQYLEQIPEEIGSAVLGNVGSLIVFRTSFEDAQKLYEQLGMTAEDLTNLAPFQAYASLLKDSQPMPVFRFETEKLQTESIPIISINQIGKKRALVEEKIQERYSKYVKNFHAKNTVKNNPRSVSTA